MTTADDIPRVIDELCAIYDESVANLRGALARFLKTGERPDPTDRLEGLFAYPELRIDYRMGTQSRPAGARLRPAQHPRSICDQHRAAVTCSANI